MAESRLEWCPRCSDEPPSVAATWDQFSWAHMSVTVSAEEPFTAAVKPKHQG
jgi:hypothetical protein